MSLRGLVVDVSFVVDRCCQRSSSEDDDGDDVEDVHCVVGCRDLYSSELLCSANACLDWSSSS